MKLTLFTELQMKNEMNIQFKLSFNFFQLPKKKKVDEIDPDSGTESPVSFSYEKAATGSSFVPFDYSKAGKIKSGM